jgi:hypothetical protein
LPVETASLLKTEKIRFPTGLGKPCQAVISRRGRVSHSSNRRDTGSLSKALDRAIFIFYSLKTLNKLMETASSPLLKLKSIKNSPLLNFN